MRKIFRLLTRAVLIFIGIGVVLAVTGFGYQAIAANNDRRNIALPGQMVNVGGYRLHIKVMGQGNPGPTVILENGGSGIVPQWGWVQPEIAQFAQVIAYDRPGTGWSEAPPEPLDAVGSVEALHTALDELGIGGPYILVGHSMGGLMTRVYAQLYPEEVAGMVLVDPRDLTWQGVYAEEESRVPTGMFRLLGILSNFGVTRLTGFAANQAVGLPDESFNQAVAIGSTPQYMNGLLHDARYGETAVDYLVKGENWRDMPVVVLSAGEADEAFNATQRKNFNTLHATLASRSSQGEHRVVPGAGHLSIIMRQEYAASVIEAIAELAAQQNP